MVEAIDEEIVDIPRRSALYVAEMRGAVDRWWSLVDDLFELVQLDAGAIVAESERARLTRSCGSAVTAETPRPPRTGSTSGDRARRRRLLVLCSPRITLVVQNLLQNAIRHTPADGTVRVEAHRDLGTESRSWSRTPGEGIEPASLERVFDPILAR